MKQQVLSPGQTHATLGKKASGKAVKAEDCGDNGTRFCAEGPSLNRDMSILKMPGGRLKGSSTYHSRDHKEIKDQKYRKEEKDDKNYDDPSKADDDLETKTADATEAMDEEAEGQNRRGQDGETFLQWGQRKRSRQRESSGLLKTSIRADRRVVRADKQVASQPAHQSRGHIKTSDGSIQEAVSVTAKRASEGVDVTGNAALNGDYDSVQLGTAHPLLSGEKDDARAQHPVLPYDIEKVPACTSGDHVVATAFTLRRSEVETFQEKNFAVEKMNLELFEWPKVVISLTRKEKEDDFTAMKGTKLPQRPKKRPKTVEKNVQFISPGTWLCDVTRERYEVREKKAVKKKPRGLKAMGSVDSDSD